MHDSDGRRVFRANQGSNPKPIRSFLVRLLRPAIAAAILVYLFNKVPTEQVFGILSSANLPWVVAAFLLSLFGQLLAAVRLKILADVHHLGLTTFEAFDLNLVTRFYGLFLPGGSLSSIAVRILRLTQVRRHYRGAITAVALDRTIATLMVSLIGIAFWMFAWPSGQFGWLLVMVVAFLALAAPLGVLYKWRPAEQALSGES